MAVNWTPEQIKAIETHGGNILVAAAAGSGKTAVLVERIIRMITDVKNPVSVDKLLVLTFTDAAAAEMKRKISAAIEEKLEQDPDNKYLHEQSIKVGSAAISTIHSFCNRIISNNVHLTDLPPEFSLIDEVENKVLQSRAVDAVLESYYEKIDKKEGFRQLVTGWGGVKSDDYLRETVVKLHDFSRSLAYPKKWLHDAYAKGYADIKKYGIDGSVWDNLLKRTMYLICLDIKEGMDILFNMADREIPTDHPLYAYYFDMRTEFVSGFDAIDMEADDGADKLYKLIDGYEIKKAPAAKGIEPEIAKKIATFRDKKIKAKLKEATELLNSTGRENIDRTIKCLPMVKTLISIVRQTERVHQRYKREKSSIDFNDLEHGMLHLVCTEKREDTPLCRDLREYYHEILIDEFQDTNALQYEIFNRISKIDGNLFMVGDVKQSIYKFRNADPSIFLRLYKSYGEGEGGQLIRLFKNFRSRKEVTDSVNFVFSSVMSERVGGIEYTEEEYLKNGATYPEGDGFNTEILITDTEAENESEFDTDMSKDELEAKNVAARIYNMVNVERLEVTDKETKELRDIKYGDIAVLCRGRAGCVSIEKALADIGVSSVSDAGMHYLDSIEVLTVLNFLQIIDNPIQDIPLVAVMRSAMFDFSADELAWIRKCKEGRYYYALEAAAEESKKAADFLAALNNLRECAKFMGVDELVWKICFELHYFSIVGAMSGGEQRKANLKLLLARCQDFEQGTLTGLFNFIKYIEVLREREADLAPAADVAPDGNAVRIMTMHKSKGLEFPVVFVSGTSKKFNLSDTYRNIIWDAYLGVGIDYIDTQRRIKYNMPFKKMIETEMMSAQKAEEMRLLYVAMTRAKEKLIISAAISERDNKWKDTEFDEDHRIYPAFADDMVRMRDWVLGAMLSHPSAKNLREFAGRGDIVPSTKTESKAKVVFAHNLEITPRRIETEELKPEPKQTESMGIGERISYVYPYAKLAEIPAKMSVSELKRRRMPEEDFSRNLIDTKKILNYNTDEINSAERGTITHYVMQRLDLDAVENEQQISAQIEKMVKSGTISVAQQNAVDVSSIAEFFACDLGKRLTSSKRCEREYDFYMLIPPKEIDDELDCDGAEDVVLQGIADCFFYEDDGIVLIDYKTDRVGKASVKERSEFYRLQIEYYSKGLESILGCKVKERYLYFLNCSEAVKM